MTHRENNKPVDRSQELSLLHFYLAERVTPCPGCGYNLRGLTQSSCPECGNPISLTVTNYPSRSGGYIAGLVGYTLSVVLALVFAVAEWKALPLFSILSLFVAAWIGRAALRWRRNRVAFSGLPRHKKQERVFVCWLGAVIFVLAIIAARVANAP